MAPEKPREGEMKVTAIRNGTVIDHIRNEATFKVAELLRVADEGDMVFLGMNLPSGKTGLKGLIKIEDRELTTQEVSKIALIAPDATVNIIQEYGVARKHKVSLPERLEGIVRCINPQCVTNRQAVSTCFDVMAAAPPTLRCVYCERTMSGPDIVLK